MSGAFNIARYLPQMAQERPDQCAVVMGAGRDRQGRVIYRQQTFAELHRTSDAYAWGLTASGIDRGKRVLLMVRAGLPLIGLTFALFKAGCVPILIDPAMGRRNLATCIKECEPDALIGIEAAHIARLLFRDAFRSVRTFVTVGRRLGWGGLTLDEIAAPVDTPFPLADVRADETAAILFTTGSTGVPKGVLYEHGMFEAQVQIIRRQYGLQPGEIEMPAFPLFALFNVALGTTSAIPPIDPTRPASCDPAAVVEFMRDQHVTSTFGSPAIWDRVTRYCLEHNIRLPELRRVLMAGAPVPTIIHERFEQILAPGAATHTPYGATESLPIVSATGREVLDAMRARNDPMAGTCVGRPVQEVTLRIIPISDDPIAVWNEQDCLPPYDIGEIAVKGPVVTKAYVNRPQSTALAKIREGDTIWHRMGDLGYQDDEGRVWFYGRKSQRVQLADRCLYTEPCELIFNRHPHVFRSALVGVRRPNAHFPLPAIIIEPRPGAWPKNNAERERFTRELLALGTAYPMTAAIQTVLFHRSFPVDIRHNAKIFREQLAVWAEQAVGSRQ